MSHFSVLVVTKNGTRSELERALQPFHEYECTGIEDQYVVEVDKTDEVNELYTLRTTTVWVDETGARYDPYRDVFYREPKSDEKVGMGSGNGISWYSKDWGDGRGYRAKVHMTAEEAGLKAVEVPISEGQSLADFAKDYGGWYERDGRFYDKTNPNARWDWWTIGGRYANRLLAMDVPGTHDRLQIKNVDFETMKLRAVKTRAVQAAQIASASNLSWDEIADTMTAKAELHELWLKIEPRTYGEAYQTWTESTGEIGRRAARISKRTDWEFGTIDLAPGQTVQEWVDAAPAISFFAALKDGDWYEKGKMGWFGCAADEKEADAWTRISAEFLASLQPDEWITFVDCHI